MKIEVDVDQLRESLLDRAGSERSSGSECSSGSGRSSEKPIASRSDA